MVFADRTLRYGVNDVAVIPPMVPHSNQSGEGFTNLHLNMLYFRQFGEIGVIITVL